MVAKNIGEAAFVIIHTVTGNIAAQLRFLAKIHGNDLKVVFQTVYNAFGQVSGCTGNENLGFVLFRHIRKLPCVQTNLSELNGAVHF